MGIPIFLLAYAAGLIGAVYLKVPTWFVALPLPAAILWIPARRRPRLASLTLILFFLTLGVAQYHLRRTPPNDNGHIRAFTGPHRVAVAGRVLAVSSRPLGRSSIDLEADRVGASGITVPVRGRVRAYVDEPAPGIRPGDRIRFLTRLRAPHAFGTPGEFDYPRYLADRGIFVTAFIAHARDIASYGSRSSSPLQGVAEERFRLGRFIDRHLERTTAPLVRALVLGDKGALSPRQRDLLARAGISHLFSISGLHLALVALILFWVARFFYRRSETLLLASPPGRILPALLVPFLLLYLMFTGSALPTIRAFIMGLAAALLFLLARRTPPLKLLASAAFLILLVQPLALFEASFQLSFAGVFGILVLVPRWQAPLRDLPRALRQFGTLWLATLAATIVTLPLVLFHFHLLAPAGLLTNLAAVPVIGFAAVPLGLAAALAFPFSTVVASVLLRGCGALLHAILKLVSWVVSFPGLMGWRLYCSPLELVGLCLGVGAVLLPGGTPQKLRRRGALALAGGLCLIWPVSPPGMTVTALSVGQGESILLSRSGDRHYLIDGGGLHSETFDVGERLVAPALGWMGVRHLEAVILSHDHPDHRKGLIHVLDHFPVKAFWSTIPFNRLNPDLKAVLKKHHIPTVRYAPGWTVLDNSKTASLALFVPPQQGASKNNRSLVLYARRGSDGVLLTGDLETAGVNRLLDSHPPLPLPLTLLKLPHHGSRHSSPARLLDALKPALTFVSAGRNNSFHFPHTEVVTALHQRGIPLFRTDRAGTVQFRSRGHGWRISHWQNGLFRSILLTDKKNFAKH